MATKPMQIRLTPSDLDKVESIRERMGLPSASSAIRYAVETVYRDIIEERDHSLWTQSRISKS